MPQPSTLPPVDPAPVLISDEYRRQQEQLHTNPDYGVAAIGFAPLLDRFELAKFNRREIGFWVVVERKTG